MVGVGGLKASYNGERRLKSPEMPWLDGGFVKIIISHLPAGQPVRGRSDPGAGWPAAAGRGRAVPPGLAAGAGEK